jgi:hypothetical protein
MKTFNFTNSDGQSRTIEIPENATELRLSHLHTYLKAVNEGDDGSILQARILGFEVGEYHHYLKMLDSFFKTKPHWLIEAFGKFGSAVAVWGDLKLDGVSFAERFDIFTIGTAAVNLLTVDLASEMFQKLTIPESLNTFNPPVSDEEKLLSIDVENQIAMLYLEYLPKLFAALVLGKQNKALDSHATLSATLANEPAAKWMAIENRFFLNKRMGMILKQGGVIGLSVSQYLDCVGDWPILKNSYGLTQRIWSQVLALSMKRG